MDIEKWSLRVGVTALACAILFRLGSNGVLQTVAQALATPQSFAVMMFLETGRVVRPVPAQTPPVTEPAVQEQNVVEEKPPAVQAVFGEMDAQLVEVNSYCGIEPDVPAMIQKPLAWDLQQDKPTVLIVHSHGSESYEKTEDYEESSAYRTRDTAYNMISIGDRIAQVLEAGGVQVLHDRTAHDHPSYNGSYDRSRETVSSILEKYPSIKIVLDVHRDAIQRESGEIIAPTAVINGKSCAQVLMLIGTDYSGLEHPNWKENLRLGLYLQAALEYEYPGLARPLKISEYRYNQQATTG